MSQYEPVYVVLLNYNRAADTIECLESLFRSDYPATRVMVVDNGSRDDSVNALRRWADGSVPYTGPVSVAPKRVAELTLPPVAKPIESTLVPRVHRERPMSDPTKALTIIANEANEGFAGGNNVAMRLLLASDARGFVCLLNNDMVVSPTTIRALVDAMKEDETMSVMGGVIFEYGNPDAVQIAGGGWYSSFATTTAYGEGVNLCHLREDTALGYIGGGCLLLRIATLRELGLLDERFFLYGEDGDWGARMRRLRYRIGFTTEAAVWHKGGVTTVNKSPFQDYHIVRAQLQYVRKHSPWLHPIAMLFSLYRSLAPKILRREWARASAVLRAYLDDVLLRKPVAPRSD